MPRVVFLALLLAPALLVGQTPASVARAAASITPEDIHRRIAILADDSMRGRDTPSPELEKVAAWVAAEFRRFGLRPGASDSSYIQRYDILRTVLDTARTLVSVSGAHGSVVLKAGRDMAVLQAGPPPPSGDLNGPVVLVTGHADSSADPLAGTPVRGAWVALPATSEGGGLSLDVATLRAAIASGAMGVLVISDRSDAEWQARMRNGPRPTVMAGERERAPGFVEIRNRTAASALGVDTAALRGDTTRRVRRLAGIALTLHAEHRVLSKASAPNVIGILEGSDPTLSHEYVFFTAHMDHVGVASPANPACRARGGDSICNGADDDASGSAAVLENAEAFAQLSPRPRRSLVFMTVSGEEKGLWGSEYFTAHPTVPLRGVVADLNSDMVGRNWKDTIAVIGREQSDLGRTLDRVAAAHPELHVTPIGDIWPSESFYTRSDHYNFARRGVPILFFFNGTHEDYHQVSDEVAKIDAEKESRIVRLIFYLGLELANSAERPRWDPASYKRVVEDAN